MQKFIEIPTIDISPLLHGDDLEAKNLVAAQINEACRGAGFFYISNHEIDVIELQSIVTDFFNTITEVEKFNIAVNAYNKSNLHHHMGYYMPIEGKKLAERFLYSNSKFITTHPLVSSGNREINVWPNDQRYFKFREFCGRHYRNMFNLASMLLQGFALSLGKDQNFFNEYFNAENTLSTISFIKRPFIKDHSILEKANNGTKICFDEHKDVSLISINFQTPIPNTQVKINDEYFDVPVSDENLLVHCGSYMSYITYNYFPAMDHRVKFVNAERLCLPFFVDLNYNAMIEPFSPEGLVQSNYRPPMLYGKYLKDERNALLLKNGQL